MGLFIDDVIKFIICINVFWLGIQYGFVSITHPFKWIQKEQPDTNDVIYATLLKYYYSIIPFSSLYTIFFDQIFALKENDNDFINYYENIMLTITITPHIIFFLCNCGLIYNYYKQHIRTGVYTTNIIISIMSGCLIYLSYENDLMVLCEYIFLTNSIIYFYEFKIIEYSHTKTLPIISTISTNHKTSNLEEIIKFISSYYTYYIFINGIISLCIVYYFYNLMGIVFVMYQTILLCLYKNIIYKLSKNTNTKLH
jgi:hypothetical protein